jgi:hypothetical protein
MPLPTPQPTPERSRVQRPPPQPFPRRVDLVEAEPAQRLRTVPDVPDHNLLAVLDIAIAQQAVHRESPPFENPKTCGGTFVPVNFVG